MLRFSDIEVEFPNVDDADVLERIESNPALRAALEWIRPRNWWGTGVKPERLLEIARDEGIALVWVPRASLVRALADAKSQKARLDILKEQESEVLADCEQTVDECDDPWLAGTQPLAKAAMSAFRDGHAEAAMALAVCLGEPLSIWASIPRVQTFESEARDRWEARLAKGRGRYKWASEELDQVDRYTWSIPRRALIAPILRFFTEWFPDRDTPSPHGLSRHVVAHNPTVDHFTQLNALLAIMLMSSLLRAQQDWSEEVRADDVVIDEG